MRFQLDGYNSGFGEPDRSDREPPTPVLDRRQCVEFLKLIHEGLGRTMACTQLGVGVKSLKRTLAVRPSFRGALEQVEQVRADNLYSVLYEAALRGDTRAARFLLARHDRTDVSGRGRRNTKDSR